MVTLEKIFILNDNQNVLNRIVKRTRRGLIVC